MVLMPGVGPLLMPPALPPPLQLLGAATPRLCSGCKNLQLEPKRHQPFDFQCLHTMVCFSASLACSEPSCEFGLGGCGGIISFEGSFVSTESMASPSEDGPDAGQSSDA